jgi:hypothetical protein
VPALPGLEEILPADSNRSSIDHFGAGSRCSIVGQCMSARVFDLQGHWALDSIRMNSAQLAPAAFARSRISRRAESVFWAWSCKESVSFRFSLPHGKRPCKASGRSSRLFDNSRCRLSLCNVKTILLHLNLPKDYAFLTPFGKPAANMGLAKA